MASQRMVKTSLWRKSRRFRKCDPLERLLYLYLLTNEDTELCGAYECDLDEVALHTGIDRRILPQMFSRLEEIGLAAYKDGWLMISNYKAVSENPKVRKGIEDGIAKLPDWVRKAMDRLSEPMTDSDSDSDSDIDFNFDTKPIKKTGGMSVHPTLGVPMNQTRYDNLCGQYGKAAVDDAIQQRIDWEEAKGEKPAKNYASAAANWLKNAEKFSAKTTASDLESLLETI